MRMEKHSLAKPSTKRAVWMGLTGSGWTLPVSRSHSLFFSSPRLYLFLRIYYLSSHLQLYDNDSDDEFYPINPEHLWATQTGLCVHMKTHTENVYFLGGVPAAVNMSGVVTQQHITAVFLSATG